MKQRRLLTSLAFALSSRRHQWIQTVLQQHTSTRNSILLQHTTTRDTPAYSYNLLPQDTLTPSDKTTKYYCSIALQDTLVYNGIIITYYWKMAWDLRTAAITSSNHISPRPTLGPTVVSAEENQTSKKPLFYWEHKIHSHLGNRTKPWGLSQQSPSPFPVSAPFTFQS